jgi:hypothetical protein
MSVNVQAAGASSGYPWPGEDEATLSAACARIARQLARSGTRVIGVLPLAEPPRRRRRGRRRVVLGPLLERLAEALAGFVDGSVGFVGPWKGWRTGGATGTPAERMRQLRPQVFELCPPACGDSQAAAVALRHTLSYLPPAMARVLVDIGEYAPSGRVPAVAGATDGVLVAVLARRARKRVVAGLVAGLPDGKCLGAILIG